MSRFRESILTSACGLALITSMLLSSTGCCPHGPPPPPETAYYGPTEPQYTVLNTIRRNNQAVRTIWARHDFSANIRDDQGKRHVVDGDGYLLFSKPHNVRLIGNKDIAGNVFEIGSNNDRFWMKIVPEMDTMWWGKYANLGKPCVQDVPIRPDLVVEVLGVSDVAADMLTPPFPIMRFNNDSDAYVLTWAFRARDRYVAQKEIWYDRASKLPKLVLLYDENGRVLLQAKLSEHQQLETGAALATHYDLLFPETSTTMTFDLHEISSQRNGVPNAHSFNFPANPGVSKVNQVDAACGQ